MSLPIEIRRFKQVRETLGMTQTTFAERLKIKNTTADIERGKVKISGHVIKELLLQFQINPLWLFGESHQKHLKMQSTDVAPKMITVDQNQQENILLVSARAAAGYADNIHDSNYYEELPAFSFPLPEYRNATFRGFQITGDSMMPAIQPDDWVLAKAVANMDEVKNGRIYIIVEPESLRIKKIQKTTADKISLVSLNPDYETVETDIANVQEIWEFHSKLSGQLNLQQHSPVLTEIRNELKEIKASLK